MNSKDKLVTLEGAQLLYNSVKDDIEGLNNSLSTLDESKIGYAYTDGEYLILKSSESSEEEIARLTGFGGGGGGGGPSYMFRVTNKTGFLVTTLKEGSEVVLKFNWSSKYNNENTGDGEVNVTFSNFPNEKIRQSITQTNDGGSVSIDVSRYMRLGANDITVSVIDSYYQKRELNFTVNIVSLEISSNFVDTVPYPLAGSNNVIFPYAGSYSGEKIFHFILDGHEVATRTINETWENTETFTDLTHGAHELEVYYTAIINDIPVNSKNTLRYSIIYAVSGNTTPIISCPFTDTTVTQYDNVSIPYIVYTNGQETSHVSLYVNGTQIAERDVDLVRQIWTYRADTVGEFVLRIESGTSYKEFKITVRKSDITISPYTTQLSLHLNPSQRDNTEDNPDTWTQVWDQGQWASPVGEGSWANNSTGPTFSGFNWKSDGWLKDKDNIDILRLHSKAKVEIPFYPFSDNDSIQNDGKTIELEFATSSVMDYSDPVISCMHDGVGFEVTSQEAVFHSLNETIGTKFKEDEHVRISFVITRANPERMIYIYINGILSGVKRYSGDNFAQLNPVGITLGSELSTLDIYRIRIYNIAVPHRWIVNNWIADMQDSTQMMNEYFNNLIYDNGEVSLSMISRLPIGLPYLVLETPELSQNKEDKKTVSGYFVNPNDTSRNFTFEGAKLSVQGTSSAGYPRKNYKLKLDKGITINNEHQDKYALREGAIPVKTFCFKADYASSEGANNVELVRYYCDICPVKTPPQSYDKNAPDEEKEAKDKIRQGIDGFPMVIFWDDKVEEPNHKLKFLGKYNFNNDKGTSEVYGFYEDPNDPNVHDQSWETKNNIDDKVLWKDDDYTNYASWTNDFESRFPDYGDDEGTKADISDIRDLATWIKSTDTSNKIRSVHNDETGEDTYADTGVPIWADEDKTTYDEDNNPIYHGATLSPAVEIDGVEYEEDNEEYRLAKFKSEIENHFDLQDTLFYYLFTEVFLMVDSRVKNSFPTRFDSHPNAKWMWLPYDMDTAIGINNEGQYSFHYYSEDIDWEDGAMVYNGQHSALWVNVRKCFFNEIKEMYHDLRTGDEVLSYEEIEKRFEDHQKMWSASIYNEDANNKYIEPVLEGADEIYLEMCLGSKAEQRKWWLYNRFKYLDSKYEVGDSAEKFIMFRAYQPGTFTITPYSDIYLKVRVTQTDSEVVRAQKGVPTPVPVAFGQANDTEVYIYSADLLKDIGNIAQLRPGYCDVSQATKLQRLQLGGLTRNAIFKTLTLGNNTLLTYIDVRNCPNLTGSINAKGCLSLKTALFEGTSIASLQLPDGGVVETLHLPATITTLEILNQPYITDFSIESYSNVTQLNLENPSTTIQSMAMTILMQMKAGSFVRITDLDLRFEGGSDIKTFLNKTSTLRGLRKTTGGSTITVDHPILTGNVYVKDTTPQQVETLESYGLTVTYDHFVMYVEFYDEFGRIKLGEKPTYTGSVSFSGSPIAKDPDAQYTYSFGGWSRVPGGSPESGILNNITDSCSLYMAYNKLIRSYEISFYNESRLLVRKAVPYGTMPVYDGITPVYEGVDPDNYGEFTGWAPEIHAVNGAANYFATFRYTGLYTYNYLMKEAASVESNQVTKIAQYAFYYHRKLRTATFEEATSIGSYAFQGCNLLSELIVPNVEYIGEYALNDTSIYSLNFPKVKECYGISTNKEILDFDFSNLEILRGYGFYGNGNTTITSMSFPKLKTISLNSSYAQDLLSGFKNVSNLELPLVRNAYGISLGRSEMNDLTEVSLPSIRNLNYFGTQNPIETIDLGPDLQSFPQYTYYSSNMLNSGLKTLILRPKRLLILSYSPNSSSSPFYYCYSTVTIYVDPSLVDQYKNATNWGMMSDRIKPIYEIIAASTLTVTANDVSGRYSTTTLHVHAEGSGKYLGELQPGTMTLDFDCISPDFGVNPTENDRTVTIEYTYGGQTKNVSFKQTGCKPNTLVIDTTRNIINTSSYVYESSVSVGSVNKSCAQLFTRGFERAEDQPYDDFVMYVSTNGYTAVSSAEMDLTGTRLNTDKEILIPVSIAKFRFFDMTNFPTFKAKAFYGNYEDRYYYYGDSTSIWREESFSRWSSDGGTTINLSSSGNKLDPEVHEINTFQSFTESSEMDHTYSVKVKDCYGIENTENVEIDRATYFLFPDSYNIEFREVEPTT